MTKRQQIEIQRKNTSVNPPKMCYVLSSGLILVFSWDFVTGYPLMLFLKILALNIKPYGILQCFGSQWL